ncbi:Zinc finger, C2CH-type [Cinara cedri]|uniref:Zinc finger, C2CH-type n=1 Tax=Cinara cedri TaxID=506608 RepID=A0A5E4NCG4_9HEMI|nr:Zinc finger, C2CH-type [Cinara cedri]
MPRCCVHLCDSRNESVFKVPENLKKEWEEALNMDLKHNSKVCATHFKSEDIKKIWESGTGFSKYTISLKRPKLKPGAIPMKVTSKSYLSISPSNGMKHDHTYFRPSCSFLDNNTKTGNILSSTPLKCESIQIIPDIPGFEVEVHDETKTGPVKVMPLFEDILKNHLLISTLFKWCSDTFNHGKKKVVSFYKLSPFGINYSHSIEKQIVITEDFDLFYHLCGEIFDMANMFKINELKDLYDISSLINEFDKIKVCYGYIINDEYQLLKSNFDSIKCVESYGRFRHANCTKIIIDEKGEKCKWCRRLYRCMKTKHLKNKNKKPHENVAVKTPQVLKCHGYKTFAT